MKYFQNHKNFITTLFPLFLFLSLSIPAQSIESDNIHDSSEISDRWAPLIDNNQALLARRNVWLNPEAKFIFFSTYEAEKNNLVLDAQIYWAVKRAREGVNVHIVLDDAGHNLGKERLLYLAENGVNLHIWSPMWSMRGYINRYKMNIKKRKLGFYALSGEWYSYLAGIFKAFYRQTTYRMHDKILYTDASSKEASDFFKSKDKSGEIILGGRNAVDSHYGLDTEYVRQESSIQVMYQKKPAEIKKKIYFNPKFEREHEVMLSSPKLFQQLKDYTLDLLESKFTERVSVKKLRKKYKKALELRSKYTENKSKLFWKNLYKKNLIKKDKRLSALSNSLDSWKDKYYKTASEHTITQDETKAMSEDFISIFKIHKDNLLALMEEKRISPFSFTSSFSAILPKHALNSVKSMSRWYEDGFLTGSEFFESVLKTLSENKYFIVRRIDTDYSLEDSLRGLKGPRGIRKTLMAKVIESILNLDFDLEEYESLEKKLKQTAQTVEKTILPKSKYKKDLEFRNLLKGQVEFIHDTVDKDLMEKKIMNDIWKHVSQSRSDIVANSQYGTPTPRGFNAMDNFLKENSSAYRLIQEEFNKPMVGISDKETYEFIEKFQDLISSNEIPIRNEFLGSEIFNEEKHTHRSKYNHSNRKKFFKSLKNLFPKGEIRNEISFLQETIKNVPEKEYETYLSKLISVLNTKEAHHDLAQTLIKNKDIFQDNILSLKNFITEDPKGILRPYKPKKLSFVTNDRGSWDVGADKFIHDDFHMAQEDIWRRLPQGLELYGLQKGGRIHSKVFTGGNWIYVGSANVDSRSDYINLEVGAIIKVDEHNKEGKKAIGYFADHIKSYMKAPISRPYIRNGKAVANTHCRSWIRRNFVRKILRPLL